MHCIRHEAADEGEAFEIMNLVDPVLRTSNSGAVLAAVNCFLLLTKDMPDMRYQVCVRVRLRSACTSLHHERSYGLWVNDFFFLLHPARRKHGGACRVKGAPSAGHLALSRCVQ